MEAITLDGIVYRVRVVYESLNRSFSIVEGSNGGTSITARTIRDIKGTAYPYEMHVEPDPRYPDDYDAFFEAISAPVESHVVELPYGSSTRRFEMMVSAGSDTFAGRWRGRNRWKGLKVQFTPITPQRIR